MEKFPEGFPKILLEKMLDLCWKQWSALGVYAGAAPEESKVIDPEALICATMFYGRYDPRLFDEALDWMVTNARVISLDRLKRITGLFSPKCRACLGASIDFLTRKDKRTRFASLVKKLEEYKIAEKDNFTLSWGYEKKLQVKDADDVFLEWGFIRNEPNLRGLSGNPDMGNDANLLLRLRKLFGVTARASVLVHLMMEGSGNSMQISRAVYASQRNVYGILNEMAEGRFVSRWSGGRESVFSLDRDAWIDFLDISEGLVYIRWADVFSAFQLLLEDWAENEKAYSTKYLASSRLREYMPDFTRKLSFAGVNSSRIPDISSRLGEPYFDAFVEHTLAYLDRLQA